MFSWEKVSESAMFQDCLFHLEILCRRAFCLHVIPAGLKFFSLLIGSYADRPFKFR